MNFEGENNSVFEGVCGPPPNRLIQEYIMIDNHKFQKHRMWLTVNTQKFNEQCQGAVVETYNNEKVQKLITFINIMNTHKRGVQDEEMNI